MATDDILTLTDGVTTLDLLRGPLRLAQDGWAPGVARLRESQLGSQGIYEDVEEELELQIVADGADNPGRIWGQLQQLLDQGRRWRRGEPDALPVTLLARPAGSRLDTDEYLIAPVYGGEAPALHTSFSRLLEAHTIAPARVTILRGGLWTRETNTAANAAAAAASQQQVFIDYTTAPAAPSPVSLALVPQNLSASAGDWGVYGVLLVGATNNAFRIIDLTTATSGGWSTVTATYTARGGSFIRYTSASSGTASNGPYTPSGTGLETTFDVATPYLIAKADGKAFQVRLRFMSSVFDEPLAYYYTEWITISSADEAEAHAFLPVPSYRSHDRVTIEVSAPAGSGELDMDTLVLHEHEGVYSYAMRIAGQAYLVGTSGANIYTPLTILADPTAYAAPRVIQSETADPFDAAGVTRQLGYVGDAAIHAGDSMYVLPLLLGGADPAHFTPTTGAAFSTYLVTTLRHDAHLVLE